MAPTATKTTLPRRELPKLNVEPVLVGIELGGELAELSQRRKAAIREAVKLRAAAQTAEREVRAAADQDREAFRQAALDDKPDPGRRFEVKAQAALEIAHREAEGATLRANTLAVGLREAINGEAGEQFLRDRGARVDEALERLRVHLEPVEDDLAELAVLTAGIEQVQTSRKPNRHRTAHGRGPDVAAMKQIEVSGGGNTPAHLVELLRNYDPRREGWDQHVPGMGGPT